MPDEYKALAPVGRFDKGDIVGGISDEKLKTLCGANIIAKSSSNGIQAEDQHDDNVADAQSAIPEQIEPLEATQTTTETQTADEEAAHANCVEDE